jgi:hypothetical protein
MRRALLVAVLGMASMVTLHPEPAAACGWYGYSGCGCYGPQVYGYHSYSYYRPVYSYGGYYAPRYAYSSFYAPRVYGWRSSGWRGGWRRW